MRVMQINTVYATGSTGRIASGLHDYLKENNIECLTAYGRGNKSYEDAIRINSDLEVLVDVAMTRTTDLQGLSSKVCKLI